MNVLNLKFQLIELRIEKLLIDKKKHTLILKECYKKKTLVEQSLPCVKANETLNLFLLQKNAMLTQSLNIKLDLLVEQFKRQENILLEMEQPILELNFQRQILKKQIKKEQQLFKAKQDKQQYLILDEWAGRQYQNAAN